MGEIKKLELGAAVRIKISNEAGQIIGVADYLSGSTQYLVQYTDAHGSFQEKWFASYQLT